MKEVPGEAQKMDRIMEKFAERLLVLSLYLAASSVLCWSFVPHFWKLLMKLFSQTNELYQLAVVAFCLLSAWCSDKLGLSLELGSFVAGIMISTTDFAQHTLDQVIRAARDRWNKFDADSGGIKYSLRKQIRRF